MNVLFIGDIVGHTGRKAVNALLPLLRDEYAIDFVVANGENMAGGRGLNAMTIKSLNDIDVITSGDHIWDQKQFLGEIDNIANVLRPANLNKSQPGRGYGIFTSRNGSKVAVINLLGRVFMGMRSNCPFEEVDRILDEIYGKVDYIFVDFHAEATSEKLAMGRYLDGRVSCVVGTHTHVQTNDATVFPNGTGYLSDLGMVGCIESILGRKINVVIKGFSTGINSSLDLANGAVKLCGVVASFDEESGKCTKIEPIQREYDE